MSTWHAITATFLVGASAAGCSTSSDDTSGTTGRAVTLETHLGIRGDLTQPKANALGWEVALSRAYLSVGALYYYSGDPVLALDGTPRHEPANAWAWLAGLLEKPAWAHPGHYIEGAAMGQMLEPATVDLLAGSLDLADGNGVTGAVNSAKFTWQSPPRGELASRLDGHVVLTEGTATLGNTAIHFLAQADVDEVHDGNDQAEVAGCAFGSKPGDVGVEVDDDGTVTLTLDPRVWFEQVDFAYVAPDAADAPEPDADGVVDIAGTLAWQGFIRGVKKGTAYEFSYTK
ncbi:MAG: hypothetical protein JW940_18565 [Polyangiaceae bacterium]|nr:hypothetical protein [Polyangiaceae bacterium]